MTQTLLENIDNIPPLPESVQEVERVYNNPDSTLDDMQKAIEQDPMLTANILRLVNSPAYGLKHQVTDLKQAVGLLGKDTIRTFALGSVSGDFEIDFSPYGMTKEQFATACDKQLSLTVNWLRNSERESLALLAPAAFLVDLGRVIISKTLIEDGKADIIEGALLAGEDISNAEITACGAQTTEVTATLFAKWNLDPAIVKIIRYCDDPYDAAKGDEKKMAAELKAIRETVMPNGEITDESIATAKNTIEEFGLEMQSYEKALEKVMGV